MQSIIIRFCGRRKVMWLSFCSFDTERWCHRKLKATTRGWGTPKMAKRQSPPDLDIPEPCFQLAVPIGLSISTVTGTIVICQLSNFSDKANLSETIIRRQCSLHAVVSSLESWQKRECELTRFTLIRRVNVNANASISFSFSLRFWLYVSRHAVISASETELGCGCLRRHRRLANWPTSNQQTVSAPESWPFPRRRRSQWENYDNWLSVNGINFGPLPNWL